jgi:hypothetical protein
MLLDDVIENYIPAYGTMARANVRSVEQVLYLRWFIITSLNTPDDRAATKRESLLLDSGVLCFEIARGSQNHFEDP